MTRPHLPIAVGMLVEKPWRDRVKSRRRLTPSGKRFVWQVQVEELACFELEALADELFHL